MSIGRRMRRAASGLLVPSGPVPFTDNFNRASLGADWSITRGSWDIGSNQLRKNASSTSYPALIRCTVERGSTDHYAEIDFLTGSETTSWFGPTVRMSANGLNGYWCLVRSSGSLAVIEKVVAGVSTGLASAATGGGPPRRLRLEAEGTDLRLYSDETLILSATSDGALDGGTFTGVNGHHTSPTATGDNFEAGDL